MKYFAFTLTFLLFVSCNENNQTDYVALNDEQINQYITKHNLVAEKSDTGLYYVIEEQGTGTQPTVNADVTVVYKGYFLNGDVFDQSTAKGVSFNLQNVVKGWTEGITYFNEGGSGILLLPAHLAYGNRSAKGIPGGSVLIFDIEVLAVN